MKFIANKLNAFAMAFAFETLFTFSGLFSVYIPFYGTLSNYFAPELAVQPVSPTVVTRVLELATKLVEGYFCPYRKTLQVIEKQDLKEVNRFCENIGEVWKQFSKKTKETYEFMAKCSKSSFEFFSGVCSPILKTEYTVLRLYLSNRQEKKIDKKQIKMLVAKHKSDTTKKLNLEKKNEPSSEVGESTKYNAPKKSGKNSFAIINSFQYLFLIDPI
jgi:hypothetical protein